MKYLTIILSVIIILLAGVIIFTPHPPTVQNFGTIGNNSFSSATTTFNNAVSSTVSGSLIPTTVNRALSRTVYVWNSGGNEASCLISSTSTGFSYSTGSFYLATSTGQRTFDATNLYTGNLWCLTKAGTTTISITFGQ